MATLAATGPVESGAGGGGSATNSVRVSKTLCDHGSSGRIRNGPETHVVFLQNSPLKQLATPRYLSDCKQLKSFEKKLMRT